MTIKSNNIATSLQSEDPPLWIIPPLQTLHADTSTAQKKQPKNAVKS